MFGLRLACAAAAIAGVGMTVSCTKDPLTGEATVDLVGVLEGLTAAAAIVAAFTSDEDDPPPDVIAMAADSVDTAIAEFCQLDPWDQATVRRQLDARDPRLRAYIVQRYGGEDGDVCTDDRRPPGPLSDPDLFGLTPGAPPG